jgi:hypothetical protein
MSKPYHLYEHFALTRASKLKTALGYGRHHKPVFPCKPGGKTPLTPNGHLDATTDPRKLHGWFNRWPDANPAMPTGSRSKVWVLDVDLNKGGRESLKALEDRHGPLPATYTVKTGSGGRHLYFALPDRVEIRNSAGKLGAGLDVRGEGGYVLLRGSVTESAYVVLDKTQAANAPTWLVELVKKPKPQPQGSQRREGASVPVDDGGPIHEGARNRTLFFVALALKDAGRSREEAIQSLLETNDARCSPPLPDTEVETIVKSAYRYPVRGKRTPPEVVEALASLKRAWWASAWRGVGGKTERDIVRILIQWAERYGHLIPAGVRISISWRDLAIAAGCGHRTIARVVKRLRLRGWLRGDNDDRCGTDSGAFVLMPRLSGTTPGRVGELEPNGVESGATLSRLPEETPCFRWRGFVGKGKAGVLYVLETFGPQTDEELAERLGFSRARDLRRLYLGGKHRGKNDAPGLIDLGLVEDRGGVFALPGQERYARRVEEVRDARYGGGPRKVRGKDRQGRMVTRVVEVPPKSEVEHEEGDRLKYEAQRDRYRGGGVKAEPVPERSTAELERVPAPDPNLVISLRAFLHRYPHRRQETPNWLGVALWAEGYVSNKPLPLAVELALAELHQEAA